MTKKYMVSLKDIAEKTGVSISTVSRVIKNKGEIAQATRDKVMKVAEELGYHNNLLIDGIKTGKTMTVGVIMPVHDPFCKEVFKAIHNSLTAKDYVPIAVWTNEENNTESIQIKRLLERRVEGIIMIPVYETVNNDYFQDVRKRGLPLVTVDRDLPNANVSYVHTNNYKGGQLAAEYLINAGHKNILHITGPDFASTAVYRTNGFEDYLSNHPEIKSTTIKNEKFRAKAEEIAPILTKDDRPTAVFAANDDMASDIYEIARDLHLNIPEDLSVIGFGNLDYGTRIYPKLTTINQFPEQMGIKAAEMLLNKIEHPESAKATDEEMIDPVIIKRDSVRIQ